MESLNLMSSLEDEDESRPTRNWRRPLAIATSLTLIFLVAVAHPARSHGSSTDPSLTAASLRSICNVTLYQKICFSALYSSFNSSEKLDPESVLKLSLRVSLKELNNATSFVRSMLKGAPSSSSVRDCADLFVESSERVAESLKEMEANGKGRDVLNWSKVEDIRTWLSASLTNLDTCSDGLQEKVENGGGEREYSEKMKQKLGVCKKMVSNSFSILTHLDYLLRQFDIKMY